MKCRLLFTAIASILFAAMASASASNAGSEYSGWTTYGFDYENTRHVMLAQINRSNVRQLVPVWTALLGPAESVETTPIVTGQMMYATTGTDNRVIALDALTGREKWSYRPELGPIATCCGPINRGVAVRNGRVFFAALDDQLIALDARSGRLIWSTHVGTPAQGLSETMAPLAWRDFVFIGSSGGDYGVRGSLSAYRAVDGKFVWRWYSVSPGWEGSYTASVHGVSLHRDIAREKRDDAAFPRAWMHGGGAIWVTPALDAQTGTIFAATGNPSPVFDASVRPGDNLYTDSIVAIDARTGKMRWAYQQTPHDVWEYEATSQPVLFDSSGPYGKRVPAVGAAGKTRWFYVLDRRSGNAIRLSQTLAPGILVYGKTPDAPKNAEEQPPLRGSIGPVSYDPLRHLVFFSSIENSLDRQSSPKEREPHTWSDVLAAIDVDTGRIAWRTVLGTYPGIRGDGFLPGSLSTSTLVFACDYQGHLLALDPSNGKVEWKYALGDSTPGDLNDNLFVRIAHRTKDFFQPLKRFLLRQPPLTTAVAAVSSSPISYEINGRQFIAIPFNAAPERATGGAEITAFALPIH